jgi:hypothetical protein
VRPTPAEVASTDRPENQEQRVTDAEGRFAFGDLAPRRYLIGPFRPDDPEMQFWRGRTVDLGQALVPPDLELWFEPLSAVSGRVLDADGAAVEGAVVLPMAVAWRSGFRELYQVFQPDRQVTDPGGQFRLSVPSGRYYLHVLPETGAAFFPQFYLRARTPEDAAPVVVARGSEVGGLDVTLVEVESRPVRFSVPPNEDVDDRLTAWLLPRGRGLVRQLPYPIELTRTEDGWLLPPLPSGGYDLLLKRRPQPPGPVYARRAFELDAEVDPEAGPLDLGAIPPSPAVRLTGRVRAISAAVSSRPPGSTEFFSFEDVEFGRAQTLDVDHDESGGSFSLDLYPGLFRFRVVGRLPAGWRVATVTSGSRDLLRDGLAVGGGPVGPIEVVVTDDGGRIEGVVRDSTGRLVPDARVLLIPPGTNRGPMTEFPTVAADLTGRYALSDVAPGQYRILALDVEGRGDEIPYWLDPEFLRRYELRGSPIRVDPGARMVNDPEVIPMVD